DTSTGERFTVTTVNARTVGGFSDLFRRHQLSVNDELLIEPLDDGTFAVTATAHVSRAEVLEAAAVRRVLDELHEAAVPVREGEVRARSPDLPADLDLTGAMGSDGSFVLHRGRWHDSATLEWESAAPAGAHQQSRAAAPDRLAVTDTHD